MFLPTTKKEMQNLNWSKLDIILISGDTYIDSSYNGTALIGKYLVSKGFKVGIISQPDITNTKDIGRLGTPELFWGVSAGCVDSMVANYTATKKFRKTDDFTPGSQNNKRPDRATIVYTNLIKRFTKNLIKEISSKDSNNMSFQELQDNIQVPIVLGGIEASLRRITHYDFWTNKLRKSILFNSKADILCYGMSEKTILELALTLKAIKNKSFTTWKENGKWKNIRGLSYIASSNEANSFRNRKDKFIELPSHDECLQDKDKFIETFNIFYNNSDPITAKGLYQKQDSRYYIQNPPSKNLSTEEIDEIYNMDFELKVHPFYEKDGKVRALDTIKNSITTHRGCYGECNFCAIAVHQGRRIIERSKKSILKEINKLKSKSSKKISISDLGGPTANMYGIECEKKKEYGACKNKRCLYPKICSELSINHEKQIDLLETIEKDEQIKKIFIASGIRYDMILDDIKFGDKYLNKIISSHISGQMKIAPEHTENKILNLMGKQGKNLLKSFKEKFYKLNKKEQFLTYYFIAAHPGCDITDMKKVKEFASKELKINPEQVQIFTPTPSTYSTLMYYTEKNPFTHKHLFVEKNIEQKEKQKNILTDKNKNIYTKKFK